MISSTARPHLPSRKSQRGMSMIELMVSLFVFSIGLLGFATLQMRSLQESFDSTQRSVAIWRSQELSDRIRANAGQLDTYLLAINNDNICGDWPTRCADYWSGSQEVAATACNATQIAVFDSWDVLCNGDDATDSALIDADISLTCDDVNAADALACSEGSALTLEVCWTSKSASSDDQIAVSKGTAALPTCNQPSAPAYLFDSYSLEFRP